MPSSTPPRLELARRDTPIQALERLPAALGLEGVLHVKRDDLTGCGLSGNKIRKLEYLLAEARDQGADTVITCGGIQSNHCRATAVAAARLGLKARLVLRGAPPPKPEPAGNLLLDLLVGAELRWITAERYAEARTEVMADEAERVRRRGGRPYVIPEGGSSGLGSRAYVDVIDEIDREIGRASGREIGREIQPGLPAPSSLTGGQPYDAIAVAVGSGGTVAGLAAGAALRPGVTKAVIGFPVCDSEEVFRARVDELLAELEQRCGLPVSGAEYALCDRWKGVGYAISTPAERRFLALAARTEGLLLDPVYTGKALRGLTEEWRAGRFGSAPRLLFIHTGGLFGTLASAWPELGE